MRPDLVIRALLQASTAVSALVGTRMARVRLPQGTTYPALVYQQVSGLPVPPINATAGGNVSRARVQVTALSRSLDELDSLLETVRVACSFKNGTLGGVQCIAVIPDSTTPALKDDEAQCFYQSIDFMVSYYES